jgi:hypothetical protein
MSRFSYNKGVSESKVKLPLAKRVSRTLSNIWISLTRDKEAEEYSVHQFGRAKLRK